LRRRDVHQRVRLTDCTFERTGEGERYARVVLAWGSGEEFVGEATADASAQGALRAAAEATAAALVHASEGRVQLDVLAVKAVEGYDTIVVVVSLQSESSGIVERLVGSCLIRGQPDRGAVLAVLSGTNRLFGKVVNG